MYKAITIMLRWPWVRGLDVRLRDIWELSALISLLKKNIWSGQEISLQLGWFFNTQNLRIRFGIILYLLRGSVLYLGFPGSSAGKESACNAGDPSSIPGLGRSTAEGIGYPLQSSWASLVAQLVKNPPAMWETWVLYIKHLILNHNFEMVWVFL